MPKVRLSKFKCFLCGSRRPSVYSFPSTKYQDIYEKWMEVLSAHNIAVPPTPEEVRQKLRICDLHFNEDDFCFAYSANKARRMLKHNSVPFLKNDRIYVPVDDETTHSEAEHYGNKSIDLSDADATRTQASVIHDPVENISIPVSPSHVVCNKAPKGAVGSNRLYELCLRQQETIAKQRKIIEDLEIRLKLLGHEPRNEQQISKLLDNKPRDETEEKNKINNEFVEGNQISNEFVAHQRQNNRKPRGRRYTADMKSFGVQMLKQGTVANYEKWRKVFVMPSRRTLVRATQREILQQTDTNGEQPKTLQIAKKKTPLKTDKNKKQLKNSQTVKKRPPHKSDRSKKLSKNLQVAADVGSSEKGCSSKDMPLLSPMMGHPQE